MVLTDDPDDPDEDVRDLVELSLEVNATCFAIYSLLALLVLYRLRSV